MSNPLTEEDLKHIQNRRDAADRLGKGDYAAQKCSALVFLEAVRIQGMEDRSALLDEIARLTTEVARLDGEVKFFDATTSHEASDMWAVVLKERADNTQLREALEGSSRIVEKYKDACMEWAKESHHKGNRQDKEFWERRAKSMANLLLMTEQALTPKQDQENEIIEKPLDKNNQIG